MNEFAACRTYVLPKLKSAGWEDKFVSEQTVLTPRHIMAYLDSIQARLASHKGMISLRELRSQTGEELAALLPSVLDRAFKGELL